MLDLMLAWAEYEADLSSLGYDLETDDSLQTAAIVSLFTDREADSDDELPAGETDRRGWWADATLDDAAEGSKIGSKLWLIRREKRTEPVRQRAEQYCREALQWLVDDGLVDTVGVLAEWQESMLAIRVRLGNDEYDYTYPWEG